jgi:hypothetical protein
MTFSDDEVQELAGLHPGVRRSTEAGITYFLIPNLELPPGHTPATTDALLCPTARDGYESRLFLATMLSGGRGTNWNATQVRILERNWFAVSWKVRAGLRLAQMVRAHLDAFRR